MDATTPPARQLNGLDTDLTFLVIDAD